MAVALINIQILNKLFQLELLCLEHINYMYSLLAIIFKVVGKICVTLHISFNVSTECADDCRIIVLTRFY